MVELRLSEGTCFHSMDSSSGDSQVAFALPAFFFSFLPPFLLRGGVHSASDDCKGTRSGEHVSVKEIRSAIVRVNKVNSQ